MTEEQGMEEEQGMMGSTGQEPRTAQSAPLERKSRLLASGQATGERFVVRGRGSATLSTDARQELLRRVNAGEVPWLEFEAIVFRAGPNRNYLRIRDEELEGFAASFVGAPFLRDHNTGAIEARAGIVLRSRLVREAGRQAQNAERGTAIRQTIRLTTQRDMRAWLEGQIDRFSIGWYYEGVSCSVCGREWGACSHKPGRFYGRLEPQEHPGQGAQDGQSGQGAQGGRVRCELIFHGVVGKEVSAVNAPAVEGTQVLHDKTGATGAPPPPEPHDAGQHDAGQHDAEVSTHRGEDAMEPEAMQSEPEQYEPHEQQSGELAEEGARAVVAHLDAHRDAHRDAYRAQAGANGSGRGRALVQGIHPAGLGMGHGMGYGAGQGGYPAIGAMRTPEEEVQGALNWLMGDTRTPMPRPHLRNLRDIYTAVTGDINFHGAFNPDYAQLQSANSGTLAGMAVNALNRAVMLHFDNMLTYRWYEQIVHVLPHDGSTQQIQLVHMDGLATLPVVAEGAPYTEATPGDSRETATFTKYGSYVGITLEMIRRSDIARIQAIPRLLVQAAIRRRSAAIAAIFTSNPTLADDNTALFHANHGNTDTTAFGSAGWEGARTRIFEQTIPGTGKPLGLWPTFCLVPIELYDDALTLFGYGSGDVGKPNSAATAQEPNIYALSRPGDPRPIPLVVPEWTDATDWAYIVDPRLHPSIVMAYANAPAGGVHALPEIFEVRSETAGLMFSHDTLPVKVRDWWAWGVSTHVGIGKNTVA